MFLFKNHLFRQQLKKKRDSIHKNKFSNNVCLLERCETQSVPPQVLHEGGEREGRCLDSGRDRVS